MDLTEFKTEYPDIHKAVFDEGHGAGYEKGLKDGEKPGYDKGIEDGRKQGAETERERIRSVEAQSLPGHEKLIEDLKFDGTTTGEQAAVKVLQAEKQLGKKVLDDLNADGVYPVKHAAPPDVEVPIDKAEDMSLPVEERAKAKWEASAGLRSEFDDYEQFFAYFKANEMGQVKILGKKAA